MTVATTVSSATFTTNGVTTAFPFGFKFIKNSDIQVTWVDAAGDSTPLTEGTSYSLTGAGAESGGTLTTTGSPLAVGTLTIERVLAPTQLTDLRNQGKYFAEVHEGVFDYLTMLYQQAASLFSRALVKPVGKNYYDAGGSNIKNLADPTATQDAATRGWAETYLGGLVAAISGLASLASGVGYTTPRTTLGLVQDMSNTADPLKGAAYVARAIRHINSLTELRATPGQYDGEVVYLRGRTSATGVGNGNFRWSAASTATDDDGITISPGGTGRWVRENAGSEIDAGWYGASVSFSQAVNTAAIQAAVNAANALGITIVRLPGKGIFLCAAITGAAAITFVSNKAYFDDFLFNVEQEFQGSAVAMPSAFSWASAWKFYAGGAPGIAKTSLTVEKAWSANEAQGIINYYVNPVSGNDANNGSINSPFKTIGAAINAASVGVVNLMPGTYYDGMGASIGNTVLRDIVFQTFSGGRDVIIRNAPDPATQTWALVASTIATYENTPGATIYRVVDTSIVDVNGDFIDLRPRSSLADVNANPGSFFYDSGAGKVYVRRYTNTAPGTALLTFRTNSPLYFQGRAVLLRNLQFEGGGGIQALELSGTRARLYAVNTSVKEGLK